MSGNSQRLKEIFDKICAGDEETTRKYYKELSYKIFFMIRDKNEEERWSIACEAAGNIILRIRAGKFRKYKTGLSKILHKTIRNEISSLLGKKHNQMLIKNPNFTEYVDDLYNPTEVISEFSMQKPLVDQEKAIILEDFIDKHIDGRDAIILKLLREGYKKKIIAKILKVSPERITQLKSNIGKKLGYVKKGKRILEI